jgi:hypothetical protein
MFLDSKNRKRTGVQSFRLALAARPLVVTSEDFKVQKSSCEKQKHTTLFKEAIEQLLNVSPLLRDYTTVIIIKQIKINK